MPYPGLFNATYAPTPLEVHFIINPGSYLSPYLFAVIISFLLGGLILGQAARYYSKFRVTDDLGLQAHVTLVLALTTLKLIQVGAVAYLDFAANYGNYLFLTHKHWTLRISVLTATIVSAAVQAWFIKRCFLLSHRNYFFLIPTLLTWLASIGSAIWVTVVFPTDWATRSHEFVKAGKVAPACTLACDLLITIFTVWYLMRSRDAFPDGESPIARLLRITFEGAVPPLVTALANVITDDQAAGGYVFLFVALTPLLQTISLLYALNSRIYFRKSATRKSHGGSTLPSFAGRHSVQPRLGVHSPQPLSGPLGSPFPFDAMRSSSSGSRASFLPFEKEGDSPRSADTFVGSPFSAYGKAL